MEILQVQVDIMWQLFGYKKTANADNIQETDLLIVDVWDAELESMNGKGSGTRFITKGTDCGWDYDYELYTYF